MDNGLIPRRYAKALYKFAVQHNSDKSVYEEMQNVISSFEADPRLQKTLSNPYLGNDQKIELLKAAAGDKLENCWLGFIKLLIDNRREQFAYLCALAYRRIYREENKISQVSITTAASLPESEMMKLRDMIVKAFPDRKLEFSTNVNPDIIGGFIVNVDDVRMDASISNEIESLRLSLIS